MAAINRTLLLSGAALLTASAIVAAPAMAPGAGMLASAPTPATLSSAQYELTALSDITLQGINAAIATGYGGKLGANDPFYPGVFDNTTTVKGVYGAAYYIIDQSGFVPLNLDRYFFEAGSKASNPLTGGLGAVAYVGLTSVLGANSLPAQLAKAVFVEGTVSLKDAVVTLTAGIPVLGELTSVYVNGTVAGDATNYGTGFAGVAAYVKANYPAIAGLVGSLNLGKLGFGSHGEGDSNDNESESEDSGGSNSGSGNGFGKGHRDDRVAAPAAAAVAPVIAVSATTPSAPASHVAAVPALAAVTSNAPVADTTPAVTPVIPAQSDSTSVAVAPKRESARGAAAGSAGRAVAAAARGAGARSAGATD